MNDDCASDSYSYHCCWIFRVKILKILPLFGVLQLYLVVVFWNIVADSEIRTILAGICICAIVSLLYGICSKRSFFLTPFIILQVIRCMIFLFYIIYVFGSRSELSQKDSDVAIKVTILTLLLVWEVWVLQISFRGYYYLKSRNTAIANLHSQSLTPVNPTLNQNENEMPPSYSTLYPEYHPYCPEQQETNDANPVNSPPSN